jgi:hypothetical protein
VDGTHRTDCLIASILNDADSNAGVHVALHGM